MRHWRPALRIARRSVRRNLGRSLLVATLVGLPVAGATMVDVVVRSIDSPERSAWSAIGAADAQASVTTLSQLPPDYAPGAYGSISFDPGAGERDPTTVDLEALLPPGSRVVPLPVEHSVRLRAGDETRRAGLVVADLGDPLHADEARLGAGRLPSGPDEVLLSPGLAEQLGDLRPGARITADDMQLTVSGLGRDPFCFDCDRVVTAPESAAAGLVPPPGDGPGSLGTIDYLVDLPDDDAGARLWPPLARRGVALTPRDAYTHPDRYMSAGGGGVATADALRAAALAAVIVGLGLLEVVLLAGTAFAVGARRQTRALGLVAAGGGSPRDVRRIVLAQGLVLGVLGAVGGVAVGGLLAVAGRPLWESLDGSELAGWRFGVWEIAGAALVGLASGLAAAIVPSVGAGRMRAVDALAGRFRTTGRARRRATTAGLALAAAGAGMALLGDRLLADDFAAYERVLAAAEETGAYASAPAAAGPVALIVGGAALLTAAMVLLVPFVIAALGKLAARLPLSPRLAFRDAARHRHRTGPATSAIAVAVAGSVVLAFVAAGNFRAEELRYVPGLPPNLLSIEPSSTDVAGMQAAGQRAATQLPGAEAHVLEQPVPPPPEGEERPADFGLMGGEMYVTPSWDACPDHAECSVAGGGLAVAGSEELNGVLAGGRLDDAARDALAAGRVVVFDRNLISARGRVTIETGAVGSDDQSETVVLRGGHLAARHSYGALPSAIVSRRAVRDQGWDTVATRMLVSYPAGTSRDDVETAVAALEDEGVFAYFESGPGAPKDTILLAIAAVAGFVTLVGVAISVALSAAEGRADLATLAAVGAPPRRRRALAASQALLVAGLGCAIGLVAGAFVAFTARATTGSPEFVIPWANLAVTALVVPALAVLVAALFTPSRLPLVRRVT